MSLFKFLNNLLPITDKADLLSDISAIIRELEDASVPMYKDAIPLVKKMSLDAVPQLKTINDIYGKVVKQTKTNSLVPYVHECLTECVLNLKLIKERVDRDMADHLSNKAVTYKTATVLRFIEASKLVTTYSRSLLNLIYTANINALESNPTDLSGTIAPAEMEYLVSNSVDFFAACKVVSNDHSTTLTKLDDIPEITVTDSNEETMRHTLGVTKLDPFGVGFIAVRWNPFYYIGRWWMEVQAERYCEAKEELERAGLKNIQLHRRAEGKRDAYLEKQIAISDERCAKLKFKISKMEKEWKK